MTTIEEIKNECRQAIKDAAKPFEMPTGFVGKSAIKGEFYRTGYMAGRNPFKYFAPAAAKALLDAISILESIAKPALGGKQQQASAQNQLAAICRDWEESK